MKRTELPNYFMADLPGEATLTPLMIEEAGRTLKRNREKYLAPLSTNTLVDILVTLGNQWLQTEYPFRQLALERGPEATGFSQQTLERGLDAFFKEFTSDNFYSLIEQDLGDRRRLDQLTASDSEQKLHRAGLATGPELIVHITAGKLPNPAIMSIVLGLLVKSAQFVKCASGTSFLPRLFAHSIYDEAPKLGACLEIAEWRGGDQPLEKVLFEQADCLTATGTDETLSAIRQRLPSRTRFLGYGHKVSFAYVASASLTSGNARRVIAEAADDVVAWNQLGCLSPHVIYVEGGGIVEAETFAAKLSETLEAREQVEPRGELPVELAGVIASRRSMYEMRAAHSRTSGDPSYPLTRLWKSKHSSAWTVVFEDDPRFQLSCLNRFIYVKRVPNLTAALQGADNVRGKVSTVGLEAPKESIESLVVELARWGVTRICPVGQMQRPSLAWRHDGRPALGELVIRTDWEKAKESRT